MLGAREEMLASDKGARSLAATKLGGMGNERSAPLEAVRRRWWLESMASKDLAALMMWMGNSVSITAISSLSTLLSLLAILTVSRISPMRRLGRPGVIGEGSGETWPIVVGDARPAV